MNKYKLKTTFLDSLHLQKAIPPTWFSAIKNTNKVFNLNNENVITLNGTIMKISKTSCKDFYWHIINHSPHIPKSNSYWYNILPQFPAINNDFWKKYLQITIHHHKRNKTTNYTIQNHTYYNCMQSGHTETHTETHKS